MVWRLDRLGRSLRHLIDTVTALEQRGVGFRSVQESIDTTTPGGRLISHVFASLAEFERDLVLGAGHTGHVRRYWLVVGGLLTVLLLLFGVVEALEVSLLTDPSAVLRSDEVPAAVLGVGLLVVDVVLPVPASLVMIAHGAAFGVIAGTALSVMGSVGAALLGLGLGRRGGPLLDRVVPQHERERADALLTRWGTLAIVVTRPVPLLAETTVLLAGASRLGWGRTAGAAALGSLPAAVLYALTGAAAADVASTSLVFGLVLALAAATWLLGAVTSRRRSHEPSEGVV